MAPMDWQGIMTWTFVHTGIALAFVGVLMLSFAGWERWRDYQ